MEGEGEVKEYDVNKIERFFNNHLNFKYYKDSI